MREGMIKLRLGQVDARMHIRQVKALPLHRELFLVALIGVTRYTKVNTSEHFEQGILKNPLPEVKKRKKIRPWQGSNQGPPD